MKIITSIILFALLTFQLTFAQAQEVLSDSGFTDIAEAKNVTVNGVKQGKWVEFVDNFDRPVSSEKDAVYNHLIIYKDGLPVGLLRKYDRGTKQLFCTIPYSNGKRNGIMKKYYYYNRGVKSEIPFINDTVFGIVKDYYETTGRMKCETPYVGNLMNGLQKSYHPDGLTVSSEVTFASGKRNGLTKEYYADGKLQYEIPYFEDKKQGIEKMYREDGGVAWEATYINGKLDDTSVKTPKKNLPDSIKKVAGHVDGFVKLVHPWCTDVHTDETANYIKPRPLPNKTMYVRCGDSNYFSKPIIMEFKTEIDGSFHICLPPGAYVIFSDTKKNKPNYDSLVIKYSKGLNNCISMSASDTICMNTWNQTPDAAFIIGNNFLKDISIIYYLPCSDECDVPCLRNKHINY